MSPAPVLSTTLLHSSYTDPTPENRQKERRKTWKFPCVNVSKVQWISTGYWTDIKQPHNDKQGCVLFQKHIQ